MADNTTTLDDETGVTTIEHEPPEDEEASTIVGATASLLSGSDTGRLHYISTDGAIFGRGQEADIVLSETTISRLHAQVEFRNGQFYLRDLGSMNGTFVDNAEVPASVRLPTTCRIRLGPHTLLQFTAVDQLGAEAFEKLRHTLFFDCLTGTGNRTYLEQRLKEEMGFARRHRQPVGVLMIDLDHFKAINDTYGHATGDRVLREVGAVLRETIRNEDSVYRYGGEEFCVLVRGEGMEGLRLMAERIRQAVQDLTVFDDRKEIRVTASGGVSCIDTDPKGIEETVHATIAAEDTVLPLEQAIVERADQALLRAKQAGRNRVIVDAFIDPE